MFPRVSIPQSQNLQNYILMPYSNQPLVPQWYSSHLPIPTYFIHVCVSTTIYPFDSNAQWKKIGIQKIFKNTTGGHSSQRFLNKKIKHTIYSIAMHHPNNYQKLLYLAFHSPSFIFSLAHTTSKIRQKNIELIPPWP
jgi:hypothetical protein